MKEVEVPCRTPLKQAWTMVLSSVKVSFVWLFVFVIFDCIWHIYGTIYIYMVYMAHIWYGIHTWYGIYGMALSSVLMSILYVYVFSCV